MRPPLWLDVTLDRRATATAHVSLATCRNCGKVKATSDPCGFDHLAAVMEFGQAVRDARSTAANCSYPLSDQDEEP